MADAKTISDEARGPLSAIDDAAARKEIGKLWTTLEGRLPATGKAAEPHTLATNADLLRVETALSKRIDAINTQSRQVIQGASQSSGSTTGTTYLFQKQVKFHWLTAGALYSSAPSILLPTEFLATVDIQMTSDAAKATQLGGSAALYVQHRAQGNGSGPTLVSAVRGQMETTQGASGSTVNDAVGGYFSVLNRGMDVNGFGVHVDAYHAPTGNNPNTYGVDVEMFGATTSQTGKTVGLLVRSAGQGAYTRRLDYGCLMSPDAAGSRTRIEYPFSVGSDWVGPLDCAIAFDAGHANANLAGLRLAAGAPIVFDGPAVNAWTLRAVGSAALQIQHAGAAIASWTVTDFIIHTGMFGIGSPVAQPPSPALGSGGTLTHYGYFAINLGGFTRWVPFFA